ncbi:IL1RA protein, partial [Cnemophilus loriae]|nr:IL1RA protein [Cnemophilus loriae]
GAAVAALSLALLFLCAEAEGFAPCPAPALQTKVFQYRLWDVNQKSLYLRDDHLVAGHLQGANAALEGDAGTRGDGGGTRVGHALRVPLCVSPAEKVFWVPNRAFEPARLPVILGIRHGHRCLT